jgi:hypothetical protein
MLREILSAMRAGEEAREGMKFKGEEACYDPVNQADLSNLRFQKHAISPITLRFECRCFDTEDRVGYNRSHCGDEVLACTLSHCSSYKVTGNMIGD